MSSNKEIDYFIQNTQIHAWDNDLILEWYPWKLFSKIEKIGQGGYGTVFRAKPKRGRTWNGITKIISGVSINKVMFFIMNMSH